MRTFVISNFELHYHNKNQFQAGIEIKEDNHPKQFILNEKQGGHEVESKNEEDLKDEVIEYLAIKCKKGDKVVLRYQKVIHMEGMGIARVMKSPSSELFDHEQFLRRFFKVKNS